MATKKTYCLYVVAHTLYSLPHVIIKNPSICRSNFIRVIKEKNNIILERTLIIIFKKQEKLGIG
jgi:hypothetical protein